MRVLSLGAGVQSTTMALMAAHGDLGPMPDCAIFADTCAEPEAVYEHLAWLMSPNVLPFSVHRVSKGSLTEHLKSAIAGKRFAGCPFFTESDRGGEGRLRRQCTREYKLEPLTQKQRQLLGVAKGRRVPKGVTVECWIGISMDEVIRVKPSRVPWQKNHWPLIEKGMSRTDCKRWLVRHDYPVPPKSACVYCPYHNDATWREMKMEQPDEFAKAVEIDELIRGGVRGTTQKLYLHRSLTPLAEVDFRTREDMGQGVLFGDECEGMCGL